MLGRLAAYGTGIVATAAASVTLVVLHQSATPISKKPGGGSDGGSDDITVCVRADSVLRSPGPGGCGPSEQRLVLERADQKLLMCDDDDCNAWGKPSSNDSDSSPSSADALADLERRVDKLRRASGFEVVDPNGTVIFTVGSGQVRLNDWDEHTAVQMNATAGSGVITTRSSDDDVLVTVGASEDHAGLAIAEGGLERIDLGRQPAGNYALRVMAASGAAVAGIGESRAGSGAVVVGDDQGRTLASATADPLGTFSVFSAGGLALASLRQSQAGSGFLSIGNSGGAEVVKMVINNNRYGVVIAGPVVGFPLITGSGIPGSYIIGCAGGEACIP